jgi:hypothetical protein
MKHSDIKKGMILRLRSDYTNINGGYGVFSSRINLIKEVGISASTQTDLYGKPWGFREE